eukprot:TRINITY_DN35810_c0_g1_i1.p1 TRINITY_DN35810_c0_g1~~TRINITY_DN35810_c0_g1_i1.p1  ORF type:complete len:169 (+),score=21.36 TRINITY_DN35810_c0_g1_i1:34-540(+)
MASWTDERRCNALYAYVFSRKSQTNVLDVWRQLYPDNDEDSSWKTIRENVIRSMGYQFNNEGNGSKAILKKYPQVRRAVLEKVERDVQKHFDKDNEGPTKFMFPLHYDEYLAAHSQHVASPADAPISDRMAGPAAATPSEPSTKRVKLAGDDSRRAKGAQADDSANPS